ncbi:MAG TPA: glycosyltransferase family 2 protein [Caproiciproducens sp.]|nr:glycosyltransferase family 2 protein [Caproiciproducens sp.]
MSTEKTMEQKTGSPLVSIVLVAFNHLDYTRLCINSLLRYTSQINYELILVNNGSSDETEEYFRNIPDAVKLTFPKNVGAARAVNFGFHLANGRYTLFLSSDLVLTYHWLDNLLTCIESDERIGMVVPVCGASSNNQQVNLNYQSLEEMQRMAIEYNASNPSLWEERMKLVAYTCLFRTAELRQMGGFDEDFSSGSYGDDALSFRYRRAGYKLILAGDTYVHHFGSVTLNPENAKNNLGQGNLDHFLSKFGIDPWQAAFIDFNILYLLEIGEKPDADILGVGKTCGSTVLQAKNVCRSRGGKNVRIYYLSEHEENMTDLKTICDSCVSADTHEVSKYFGGRLYDYIIVESDTARMEQPESFFRDLSGLLKPEGQLVCTAKNKDVYERIHRELVQSGLIRTKKLWNFYYCFQKPLPG